MDPKLILPLTFVHLDALHIDTHLYFLAGPIGGSGDWHERAIPIVTEEDLGCYIACPKRFDITHPLSAFAVPDELHKVSEREKVERKIAPFPNQKLWERHYMEIAAWRGCIIIWLPEEDKLNPRKKGPYAQDTRGEIGRWSVRSAYQLSKMGIVRIAVGAEKGFPGLGGIKKDLDADHQCDFPIFNTLEETIRHAVSLAPKKRG
jgi:hypothetical protein